MFDIGNRKLFWVRMKDIKKGLGMKNISDLVRKKIHGIYGTKNPTEEQIRIYKMSEKELDKKSDSSFKQALGDLMPRIIKNCRGERKEVKKKDDFRLRLGFKEHDVIITKEDSIIPKIMKVFPKENIKLQHSVLNYYIDLYFLKYRLSVEIDEKGRLDRDKNKEKEKSKKLHCELIRSSPDKENFDAFVEIGKIYDIIDEIKEKSNNESIDSINKKRICRKDQKKKQRNNRQNKKIIRT